MAVVMGDLVESHEWECVWIRKNTRGISRYFTRD